VSEVGDSGLNVLTVGPVMMLGNSEPCDPSSELDGPSKGSDPFSDLENARDSSFRELESLTISRPSEASERSSRRRK
jgi:hypothetical protein